MLQGWVIVLASFLYLGVLFGIAWYADRRADTGRSLISNPVVYALSLGVYCTTWTFYGSVGRAAATGIGFLPIYLGPTLLFALAGFILHKMIRVSQGQPHHLDRRLRRLALRQEPVARRPGDGDRRGRRDSLHRPAAQGRIQQLCDALASYPEIIMPASAGAVPLLQDSALVRGDDPGRLHHPLRHAPSGRHRAPRGAWWRRLPSNPWSSWRPSYAVGVFVVWGIHDGVGDLLYAQAAARTRPGAALHLQSYDSSSLWRPGRRCTLLSMMAIAVSAAPVSDRRCWRTSMAACGRAVWLFPALSLRHQPLRAADSPGRPAALSRRRSGCGHVRAGAAHARSAAGAGADCLHRRAVRRHQHGDRRHGGAETMVCNDLRHAAAAALPGWCARRERRDLSGLLLAIRRIAIAAIILVGLSLFPRSPAGARPWCRSA
jgi:hypothetical protein